MRSSSSAIWRLTVGGARFNARAASANEPRSVIAIKVRRRSRLISRMSASRFRKTELYGHQIQLSLFYPLREHRAHSSR